MNINEEDFLRALDVEDALIQTSASQREANKYKREHLEIMKNRLPNDCSRETVFLNLSMELMEKRLKDPTYRFSVRGLMED